MFYPDYSSIDYFVQFSKIIQTHISVVP